MRKITIFGLIEGALIASGIGADKMFPNLSGEQWIWIAAVSALLATVLFSPEARDWLLGGVINRLQGIEGRMGRVENRIDHLENRQSPVVINMPSNSSSEISKEATTVIEQESTNSLTDNREVILPQTPKDIFEAVEGLMSIELEPIIQSFVGRTITARGKISDIEMRDEQISVSMWDGDILLSCDLKSEWKQRAMRLRQGEEAIVTGKFSRRHEKRIFKLIDCQIAAT